MRLRARRIREIVGSTLVAIVVAGGIAACTTPSAPPAPGATDHLSHHAPFSAPPAAPLRGGERFLELGMAQPYTPRPSGNATDVYRCFLVDPGFTERVFVTGSQFLPENADIVHHAIFFRVQPGDVAQAKQLDAAAEGDGWTCFGGTGVGSDSTPAGQLTAGSAWIAAWAPGGKETLLRSHTGYEMAPGSQVIMQIHYNLLRTGGKPTGTDQSRIRLRLMDGSANLAPLLTTLVPAPVELPCTAQESGPLCDRTSAVLDVWQRFGVKAGAAVAGLNILCNAGREPVPGPTQHCDLTIRSAGTVYAVAGHMHLLGRSITVELNPGKPNARMLLNVPTYDFDDQSSRVLATPVAVKPGDIYRVTCTHDAALRSQLPALRGLAPRYVVWGEGTSDEMCLGIVVWSAQPLT